MVRVATDAILRCCFNCWFYVGEFKVGELWKTETREMYSLWDRINSFDVDFILGYKYNVHSAWGWSTMTETCSMCWRDWSSLLRLTVYFCQLVIWCTTTRWITPKKKWERFNWHELTSPPFAFGEKSNPQKVTEQLVTWSNLNRTRPNMSRENNVIVFNYQLCQTPVTFLWWRPSCHGVRTEPLQKRGPMCLIPVNEVYNPLSVFSKTGTVRIT